MDNWLDQLKLWIDYAEKHPNKLPTAMRNIRGIAKAFFQAHREPPKEPVDLPPLIHSFITSRSWSVDREAILSGAFYADDTKVYFRMDTIMAWMRGVVGIHPSVKEIANAVRLMGGDKKFFHFEKTGLYDEDEGRNMWWLPVSSIKSQNEGAQGPSK